MITASAPHSVVLELDKVLTLYLIPPSLIVISAHEWCLYAKMMVQSGFLPKYVGT